MQSNKISIFSKLSIFYSRKVLYGNNVLYGCRNGHVIELVTSKSSITEINLEPSNYANDFENNTNSDNIIVSLIKSSNFVSSEKRYQEHRPESFKRNISNGKINNTA